MAEKLQWRFDPDPQGLRRGTDPALTTFADREGKAMVRELIQNALDARDPHQTGAVVVTFRSGHVETCAVDLDQLEAARAAARAQLPPRHRDAAALRPYREAKAGRLSVLVVEDARTTGADRERWDALTRSEGVTGAKDAGAMGSFGFGKNAAMSASPLHAVTYATRYYDRRGCLATRFVGRAKVPSHQRDASAGEPAETSRSGQALTLPDTWLTSTQGEDVAKGPEVLMPQGPGPGTAVAILGYPTLTRKRTRSMLRQAAMHYFPAIAAGALCVRVDGKTLDAESIEQWLEPPRGGAPSPDLRDARAGLRALREGEVARRDITGVGQVTMHMHADAPAQRPTIFLVRGDGLVITRRQGAMGPARPAVGRSAVEPFTAVVHVTSGASDDEAWLRACESPAHDEVRPELAAPNEARAREALARLAQWTGETLTARFAAPPARDRRNASELAHLCPMYLPSVSQRPPRFTEPRRRTSARHAPVSWRQLGLWDTETQGETPGTPPAPRPQRARERGHDQAPRRHDWVRGMRLVSAARGDTHRIDMLVTLPAPLPEKMHVGVVPEDRGAAMPVALRSAAMIPADGGAATEIAVKNGGSELRPGPETAGRRVRIRLSAAEPIAEHPLTLIGTYRSDAGAPA